MKLCPVGDAVKELVASFQPYNQHISRSRCPMCRFVVDTVKNEVAAQHSEDQIKHLLKGSLCPKMGEHLKHECERLAKSQVANMVASLGSKLSYCDSIGHCTH